ncbi:hypothetical protein F3Y22_tig00112347pilonHSYRG00052 [Hibiscus syriacus]|uniref:Uncharacterized protein n=1 Tax=Hibiscus syriacus TaxID=106335 RepID=A0A6A2XM66_HIBSY|nr:hypothetical protein F3Y22_tig00112347pilonHSYRG00052 [Hibiscus syriacus]
MEKQFVDLLTEELKLQEAVAEEHSHLMNITFGEAKRVASQYQKEVEKCITSTETCEEERERVEASLIRERKSYDIVGATSSSNGLGRGINTACGPFNYPRLERFLQTGNAWLNLVGAKAPRISPSLLHFQLF